jgi:hypothetical protein
VHALEQAAFPDPTSVKRNALPSAPGKVGGLETVQGPGQHSYRLTTPSSHVFVQVKF